MGYRVTNLPNTALKNTFCFSLGILKKEKALPRPGIIQSPCGLSGFEPGTFRSSVWRSPNWAISADVQVGENLFFYFQRRIVSLAKIWINLLPRSDVEIPNKMALPTLQPYWLKNYKNRNEGLLVRRNQFEADRREAWDKNARYFDRSNVETTKQRVWGSRESYEER